MIKARAADKHLLDITNRSSGCSFTKPSFVFQNEEIFVQLDELD